MQKHSKQSNVSIRRFLCVSMLIVGISIFSSISLNATTIPSNPLSYSSLTSHDPIFITSDSGLEVFLGSGTEEDPYVIEGYSITTTNYAGIYISGTTKYFVIRNSYVDAEYVGIDISDVTDETATVINNTCKNNNSGIWLQYSVGSTVVNNTCNSGYYGIKLSSSSSSTVANNTCNSNYYGIKLSNSGSSTVANNKCNNNNWDCIYLQHSGSSTVANNTSSNCGLGIIENTVDAYLSYTLENNWVNGKKLGFYTNLDSTTIDEQVYGQMILVNCTNVTVRDQILNSATTGLFLYSCTCLVVINNTCNNNNRGIFLLGSGSSTVANNTCNNNREGIGLWSSGSSTVANSTCNNNREGIYLSSSGSSDVINNICNNNWHGIALWSSDFCVITYNLLQGNEKYGVYLNEGDGGYYLGFDSDNNLIHHNTFVDNNLGGTSQGYDGGTNNFWYDTATLEGNFWSDWSGTGSYYIQGSASSIQGSTISIDPYPLDEPVEYSTDETQIFFTFTLLLVLVPLLLTKLFSRKRR